MEMAGGMADGGGLSRDLVVPDSSHTFLASGMNSSVFLGTNPHDGLCHDPPRVWMAAGLPYPIRRPL